MKAKAVVPAGLVSQQFSAEQWLAAAAQELGAEVKPPKDQDGRVHKGPVACTKCGVPKIDEEQLKKHKQSCKFVCTDCGKQFARETAFIKHKSAH